MKSIIKIYKWVPVLFTVLVFVSCDDYLGVDPKGVQLLTSVDDYDEWLNNDDDLEKCLPDQLLWLSDDIDDPDVENPVETTSERIYTWEYQFSLDLEDSPVIWDRHYQTIYYFNTVIQGIDDAEGDDDAKASLKAEALLGRAYEYLYLVNLYGKLYDESTASSDLAVPFVTSNDINDDTPDRSTVQEIYDYIIADITAAIPDLPEENSDNRFRGSVAAAYSVLARMYLYMGNYTKAAANAQLAMDNGSSEIVDYSTMSSASDITHIMYREDAIYARLNEQYTFTRYPTLSFLKKFDTTDLRLAFFYKKVNDYSFDTRDVTYYKSYTSGSYHYLNWGTSVAEMRLIIAEAAARSNELETAIEQLDLIRKCRFPSASYTKFDSSVQEEVLQKVLDERRFELAFRGFRWFDMRRLDAEGRMEAVSRYDGEETLMSTLSPGSAKYTLQIPDQVLYFNPGWDQNGQD